MRTRIAIVAVINALFACAASAQQFNVGMNFNPMPFKAEFSKNIGTEDRPVYEKQQIKGVIFNYQVNGGFDYQPLKFKDDQFSFGVNLNFGLGYLVNPKYEGLEGVITINVPEYIAFRYKARATKDSDEPFGLGVGVGYNYQIIPFRLGSPSVFVDVTFAELWFIKLSLDIKKNKFYDYHSHEGYVPAFWYREIGFQIGRAF